jgi:hypothetical protein
MSYACAALPYRMVGLPSSATAASLLAAGGKKSGMKQSAAWKMGPKTDLDVKHVDGGPMKIQMQVCACV